MINTAYRLILVLLVVVILAGCTSSGDKDSSNDTNEPPGTPTAYTADNPAHILILHSYHLEYLWEQELNRGILDGLARAGYSEDAGNIVLDYFWMDTKRQTDPDYGTAIGREAAAYIEQTRPDLVIATDDNAFHFVVGPWQDSSIPFVVAGLNGTRESYGLDERPNVAVVLEEMHFNETMAWIKRVLPDATNVTLLSDQSNTATALISEFVYAMHDADLYGDTLTAQSFALFQDYATRSFDRTDVFVITQYHTLVDEQNNVVDSNEVLNWLITHSPIPVVAVWDFSVQGGALGGSVISGESQGFEAGYAAARILNGETPQTVGFVTPKRGKLTINKEAAARWNVEFPLDLLEVSQIYASGIDAVNR